MLRDTSKAGSLCCGRRECVAVREGPVLSSWMIIQTDDCNTVGKGQRWKMSCWATQRVLHACNGKPNTLTNVHSNLPLNRASTVDHAACVKPDFPTPSMSRTIVEFTTGTVSYLLALISAWNNCSIPVHALDTDTYATTDLDCRFFS
jgi:hypothetical protein